MRTTIKAKVHLLAADKILITTPARCEERQRTIVKADKSEKAYIMVGRLGWYYGLEEVFTPQHLYFTTDEEIKEGDWFIGDDGALKPHIYQSSGSKNNHIYTSPLSYRFPIDKCRKIVATTNSELWVTMKNHPYYTNTKIEDSSIPCIPKIDIPFIEAYIKAYNEGKQITQVFLEQNEFINQFNEKGKTNIKYTALKLKPNDSVTVHPVKERMYTRTELKAAIAKSYNDRTLADAEERDFNLKQWFEENYPE